MREVKLNINQVATIVSILYINNAFFGFIKANTALNAFCLLWIVLWLVLALTRIGFLQECLRTCTPLLVYTLFLIMTYLVTGREMGSQLWQNLRNALFSLVCAFLCLYTLPQSEKRRRNILRFLLLNILLGSFYTLYRIRENPLLPRILAMSSENVEKYLGGNVSTVGIITYGGVYGMALAIPSLLYWISQKRGQKKIIPLAVTIVFVVTLFRAQFAIAWIFVIVGFILYLILGGQSKYRYIVSGFFVLIAIIIAVNWDIILLVVYSADVLPDVIQKKANELLLFSGGGDLTGTNLNTRLTYYAQTFDAVVQNKFLGKVFLNKASGAGHSEWEDMAANYGIIAPILVFSFFHKFTKRVSSCLEGNALLVYRIQLLMFFIIGFVDPIFHSRTMSYLMILSPLILTLYHSNIAGENSSDGSDRLP